MNEIVNLNMCTEQCPCDLEKGSKFWTDMSDQELNSWGRAPRQPAFDPNNPDWKPYLGEEEPLFYVDKAIPANLDVKPFETFLECYEDKLSKMETAPLKADKSGEEETAITKEPGYLSA